MLRLLENADWLTAEPVALASARGAGTAIPFRGGEVVCREVDRDAFAGVDIALFSAGGGPSRAWAPVAAEAGAWVVDNSSAWRMDPEVPLVVPEVNADAMADRPKGIVANPNCTTMVAMPVLDPLHREAGLEAVLDYTRTKTVWINTSSEPMADPFVMR